MIKSLAILFFIVGISSCGGGDDDKRYKFLETILVSGTCWEDHVNIKDKYSGFIVRKYDNRGKRESIHGEVHMDNEQTIQDNLFDITTDNMYKYRIPNNIDIWGVPIEVFNQNKFVLRGVSRHYHQFALDEDLQYKVALRYYSTCTLEVTERKIF